MWLFSRDPTSSFPYEIGEKVEGLEEKSVWNLHNGKKKVSQLFDPQKNNEMNKKNKK